MAIRLEPTRLSSVRSCRGGARLKRKRWADGRAPNTQADNGKILNMEITEKQRAIEALQALPDQATIEDAIERLCFIAKIEEGLRQSDARQLVSHDEIKKQFLS